MGRVDWNQLARVIDVFSSAEDAPNLYQFYTWSVDRMEERDLEPEHVLEVGCGTGLLAGNWVEWYPEAALTLIDTNGPMLEVARERFEDVPCAIIVAQPAEAYLAAAQPDSTDVIVFCRSWYALRDLKDTAANAIRTLRPGGMVFMWDFTGPVDLGPRDEFFAEHEPEIWPQCRQVYEDFNRSLVDGSYHVHDRDAMQALWGGAGAELVAYQCLEPDTPNHQLAIAKPG